eukprot:SAG11_NODE_60_length_19094_cov_26.549566_2_plen_68_part_00
MTPEIKVRVLMSICTTLNLLNLCRLVEKFRLFHAITNFSKKKKKKNVLSANCTLLANCTLKCSGLTK